MQEDFIMKPFLGIDLTTNSKNEQTIGNEFLIKKTPTELTLKIQMQANRTDAAMHKSHISSVFQFLQYGFIAFFFITLSATLRSELSFVEKYHNAPWLYWSAIICGIIGFTLSILGKRRRNQSLLSNERLLINLKNNVNDVYKFLSIPDYAEEIDILSFAYTTKNGQVKLIKNTLPVYQFSNCIFKIYSDSENLYLSCLKGTYAFPLSSLIAIQTIKKRICIKEWHKEVPYNKGFYKQFHLSSDYYGCIHCSSYYILKLVHRGIAYGIYIPCYDIAILEKLTGLKAQ